MNAVKSFFKNKGVGYYLLVPALICAVLSLILYHQTGITAFNPALSTTAIVCLWISAGLCLFSLILEIKPVKYAAYLICLFGFIGYIQSQITYITNVFVAIDGSSFSAGFIATAAAFALAFILMLLSAILTNAGKKKEA